ncbi:hypothetical protein Sste5346_002226 [Sporothrix stenoceras]|uniref:Uncharacterized protein n=1 Tax=Sporothrix stenoceras TaxID=5173 RepID=A0ABR3ZIH5_9PEZI
MAQCPLSFEQRAALSALQDLQDASIEDSADDKEDAVDSAAPQQDSPQNEESNNIPPGMDPQVSRLHISIHERLQRQRATQHSRRTIAGVSVPWPRRWAGSLQWRREQAQRQQLWESSFDGTTGTLTGTGGLTSGITTSITQQLCDDLSATHQLSLTANFAGTTGATVAPPAAASAAAAATAKKNAKRSKLLGDLEGIPARWKWFLNPRETVFEWAKNEAREKKRIERKQAKKAKKLKAKALKALKEQEAQLVQQSQSVDVYGPGVATGEEGSANDGARTVVQRLEEEARTRAAAALVLPTTANTTEVLIESEAFAAAAVAPRLVTQYGHVWVRPQTMYGEGGGSVAATGDGATPNVNDNDNTDDDASSDYENGPGAVASPPPGCTCGVAAPPNSVADSGYGHMDAPVIFEQEDGSSSPVQLFSLPPASQVELASLPPDSGAQVVIAAARVRRRCRIPAADAVGGVDGASDGTNARRRVKTWRESSGDDDARSFVTCFSRPQSVLLVGAFPRN